MEGKKRPRRLDPEVRAELDARYVETTRLLEERIAYHRQKLAEERERATKPAWRRLLRLA
jgi:hypothetical protein